MTDSSLSTGTGLIFISYARKDSRNLALQLHQDLQKAGYQVWLDTAEIDGGIAWSSAIEAAIEQCKVTLALLSTASYSSEICRAEQLRSIRKGKRIIPIIVQPGVERPLYLEHLNYRDFSEPGHYDQSLTQLFQDLTSAPVHSPVDLPRPGIMNAPPLPSQFIPRESDLDRLRQAILAEKSDRPATLIALHGMGGIGKSVLAAALCHDSVIQDAFPDGIIWVRIGRDPGNLLEQIKLVGTKLGDTSTYYTSELAGLDRLRLILPTKAALIVLDDVWDTHHVEAFQAEAARCRTLFTTRNRSIALTLGAQEVQVGALTPEQARALLSEWANRDDAHFADIASRLGNLPLALKLAGVRLREGMSSDEWLRTFQHVSQMKLGRRSNDPSENLEVCFDLSVQQLSDEDQLLYHTLGIFPEDISVPQSVIIRLWRQIDQSLTDYDAAELVIDLARLALIDRNIQDQTVSLHDLLHDYTRLRLGTRLPDTHGSLLKAYNPDGKAWPDIPHDGYLYNYLPYHLLESGQSKTLYQLLIGSPEWMNATAAALSGDAAFLQDLTVAEHSLGNNLTPDKLLILFQIDAARRAVSFRVERYSDDDLRSLVLLEREDEALAHARARQLAGGRFNGLLSILDTLAERRKPIDWLVKELTASFRDILGTDERAVAVSQMARILVQNQEVDQALQLAETIPQVDVRSTTYCVIADYLKEDTRADAALRHAMEAAALIDDANAAIAAWAEIAGTLANWDRSHAKTLLANSLVKARAIRDDFKAAQAMRSVVEGYVKANDFEAARSAANVIPLAFEQAAALVAIVAGLVRTRKLDQALDTARIITQSAPGRSYEQSLALITVASAMESTKAAAILEEAHDLARQIGKRLKRVEALCAIASHAVPERAKTDLEEALALAHSIPWQVEQNTALGFVTSALAKTGQFDLAIEISHEIENLTDRQKALSAAGLILARAGDARAGSVLNMVDATRRTSQDVSFIKACCQLVGVFSRAKQIGLEPIVSELVNSVRQLDDPFVRAINFAPLVTASRNEGETLFNEMLAAVYSIGDPAETMSALRTVAVELIRSEDPRAEAITEEALDISGSIVDADARAYVLGLMAAHLAQAGRVEKAEIIAAGIGNAFWAAMAQVEIAIARGYAGQVAQGIELARSIEPPYFRVKAMAGLAMKIKDNSATELVGVVTDALATSRGLKDLALRSDALGTVAAALRAIGQPGWQAIIDETLRELSAMNDRAVRQQSLDNLADTLAAIGQFAQAFDLLPGLPLDDFIARLAQWSDEIDKNNTGLTLKVLQEVTRIAGWVRPDWQHISALLTPTIS